MFKLVVLISSLVAVAMGNIPQLSGYGHAYGYGHHSLPATSHVSRVDYPTHSVPIHVSHHGHYNNQQSPWDVHNQHAQTIAVHQVANPWANQGYNNHYGHGVHHYQPAVSHQSVYQQHHASTPVHVSSGWDNLHGGYSGAHQAYGSYGHGSLY